MINWSKESETHATSSCNKYSVYQWGALWIADCNGKAKVQPSKEATKASCEEQQSKLKLFSEKHSILNHEARKKEALHPNGNPKAPLR